MKTIFRINSITELHNLLGYQKPRNPLITVLDFSKIETITPYQNQRFIFGFYSIMLKDGCNCQIGYGRESYDFAEGGLIFMAPEEVVSINNVTEKFDGWLLCFHPDLIRGTKLGKTMDTYSFFHYFIHEALHLSEMEKLTLTNIFCAIKEECHQNIDIYTNELINSNLEVLLNYSKRYYGRQFITRRAINTDQVERFKKILRNYFKEKDLEQDGIPSVKYLANEMGYSSNYLSDLLKQETGKSTQEHIHYYLIEMAKNMLVESDIPIYHIAEKLGFEFPANFSKFFKQKTGITPASFRKQ